ncbi:hypothetical protein HYY75_10735 [bacterium]|nr:hypothetical protein [bacterium]
MKLLPPRQSRFPFHLFFVLVFFGFLGFEIRDLISSARSQVKFKSWVVESKSALLQSKPIPIPPLPIQELIATAVPSVLWGFYENEVFRVKELILPGTKDRSSTISFEGPWLGKSKLVFEPPTNHPIIVSSELHNSRFIASISKNASPDVAQIKDLLRSFGGGFTVPQPFLDGKTFLDGLSIELGSPAILLSQEVLAKALLGPLNKEKRDFSSLSQRFSDKQVCLPWESSLMPEVSGLFFEGIIVVPNPKIEWTPEFCKTLKATQGFSDYEKLWERRSKLNATWLPLLSEDIRELLGSGYLRFNRPDVLFPDMTLLTPMDEINLLRALHRAKCESNLFQFYPKAISAPASQPLDPFEGPFLHFSRDFNNSRDLLREFQERAAQPFDQVYLLSNGDLKVDSLKAEGNVFIGCANGSIDIHGNLSNGCFTFASKGGNINIHSVKSETELNLVSIKDSKGLGGKVIFMNSINFSGRLRAETIELASPNVDLRVVSKIPYFSSNIPILTCTKIGSSQKKGERAISTQKLDSSHSFGMKHNTVISNEERNLYHNKSMCPPSY